MKCVKCGCELPDGSLVCRECGTEAEIVPDYTVLEDDYLKAILEGTDHTPDLTRQKETQKEKKKKEALEKKERQKRILIGSSVAAVLGILLLVFLVKSSIDSRHASSYDYQVEKAEEALLSGDTELAAEYYERALSLSPEDIDVRLRLAKIYMAQREYDAAMILYLEVTELDGDNADAYKNLISIYESEGRTEEIVALGEGVTNAEILALFADYMVLPPVFSYESGTYESYIKVELSAEEDCEIYYTTDGTDPVTDGSLYTDPISLNRIKDYEILAVCVNEKGIYSEVAAAYYTIDIPAPDMPVVTPDGGNYTEETLVTVEVPDGCTAYYTWDGTDPNITSAVYTEPFAIPEGNHVLSVLLIDNTTEKLSSIYRQYFTYYP